MAESMQAQINDLKRTVEKYHEQHKNLKRKVTQLARRLRTLEPFTYAEERDLLCLYLYEFREFLETKKASREENNRWPMKEAGPAETP